MFPINKANVKLTNSSSSECSAQGQVFYCKHRNLGCSSIQRQVFHCKPRNQGCSFIRDSFPFLSAPHSLFSIWEDLKRSEKIQWTWTWRWGEWIWLTGSSGLHRNSPQGLNVNKLEVDKLTMCFDCKPMIYINKNVPVWVWMEVPAHGVQEHPSPYFERMADPSHLLTCIPVSQVVLKRLFQATSQKI